MESGTRLGPYEIIEQLGAGGMGEVWLAEDTRLHRKVAIKVLPPEFASDRERVARFEQEARAAAALNHPNIAAVFDVGEHDAGVRYIVQEYLEGQSLRDLLRDGPPKLERALTIGADVAEALAVASAAGIVHRDIKPDNIFITGTGHAKVLDFGLAKLVDPGSFAGASGDSAPTAIGTIAGAVMGTVGYMAPEQVEAGEIDRRTDLFALGCVLYEMVTGKRPFEGGDIHTTLGRIVSTDPEPIQALQPGLPSQLQWIIAKCLAKLPARRYQHAEDIAVDLRQLQDDITAGTTMPVGGLAGVAPTALETAHGIPWKLVAPIAVASALLAAFGVWIATPSSPEPIVTRFTIDYPPETIAPEVAGVDLEVAISPDGKSVVFRATRQLWLRAIDDLVAAPIRGTEGAAVPFFSPDGQRLGFWGGDGQIKSVPITGGAPVPLGPAPQRAYGASWAADGYIYFGQAYGGISRVPDSGGEAQVVVAMEGGEQAYGPQLLPGGEWLLFTLLSGSGTWNDASIVAQRVSGGERKLLVNGGTDGRYAPSGHIVYSLEDNLLAVPFDAASIEVTGGPVFVVDGVQRTFGGLSGASQYAFSDSGALVYRVAGGGADTYQLAWVDGDDQVEPLPFEPRPSWWLDLSADDQRIALGIEGDEGDSDIWIYEIERGGSQVRLTTEGHNRWPVWSPDGEWIFFASTRGGNSDIWKRRADRSLDAELVLDAELDVYPTSISDDGEMLAFTRGLLGALDVGILDLDTGDVEMVLETAANETVPSFSPDGRFLAFTSNETGQYEVYVREVSSGRTFPVSTSTRGGWISLWSRDGRKVYYSSPASSGILVAEVDLESFSAADPVQISDIVLRAISNFDVTADGQKFLVTVPAGSDETAGTARGARLNVVLNWFEELRQRVPTGR